MHVSNRIDGRVDVPGAHEVVPRWPEREIWALATAQHGVVARAQLVGLGLGDAVVRARREAGWLRPVYRGVYAVGHGALTQRSRWMAAVLACGPGAALSHRSAAVLLGLVRSDRGLPDVSVPRGGGRSRPGIAVHRVAGVQLIEAEAIACTTVARTLVDFAGVADRRTLERAIDEAEVQQTLDMKAIEQELARTARARGSRQLLSLLADHAPPTTTLTKSRLEERFLALCRRAGLPKPRVNQHLFQAGGAFEVDFHWPRHRLVVETDGGAFHDRPGAWRNDRHRDRVLQLAGWMVLRFPYTDVTHRPDEVVTQLRTAFARRGTS